MATVIERTRDAFSRAFWEEPNQLWNRYQSMSMPADGFSAAIRNWCEQALWICINFDGDLAKHQCCSNWRIMLLNIGRYVRRGLECGLGKNTLSLVRAFAVLRRTLNAPPENSDYTFQCTKMFSDYSIQLNHGGKHIVLAPTPEDVNKTFESLFPAKVSLSVDDLLIEWGNAAPKHK